MCGAKLLVDGTSIREPLTEGYPVTHLAGLFYLAACLQCASVDRATLLGIRKDPVSGVLHLSLHPSTQAL